MIKAFNEEEAVDVFIAKSNGFYTEADRDVLLNKIVIVPSPSKTDTSQK